MRLAAYELVKLWQKRLFLVLSLLLLAANLLTLYLYEKHTPAFFYVHQQREDYQRFLQGDEAADSTGFYRQDLDGQESYLQTYTVFVEEMADRVRQMEQVSIYADRDSYVHRNLVKTQADFASFFGAAPVADNCFGIRALANYDGGLLFTLVFLTMLAYYVCFFERDQNLLLLLKGCRNGHTPLAAAKLAVMLLAAGLYTLLQEAGTILLLGWMYGYGDLGRMLQSVSIFRNCALHLTVGEALAAITAVRIAAALVLVCGLFFLGMLLKNEATAALVFGGLLGTEYLLNRFLSVNGSTSGLKCVNLFYLWNMRSVLGEYHNLNIAGFPVSKSLCALLSAGVIILLLSASGIIAFRKTCQIKTDSFLERLMQWLRSKTEFLNRQVSLLYYELYKLLIQQKKGIVLTLLLIWGGYEANGVFAPVYYATAREASYHHYIAQVRGPVTGETFAFFESENDRLEELRRQAQEVSGDELQILLLQNELDRLEEGFELARIQFAALQEKPGVLAEKYMLDEEAYGKLWGNYTRDIGLWLAGAVLTLFFVSGIYAIDEKRKMNLLLRTTCRGREKLNRSRDLCTVLCTGAVFLIVEFPLFLRYWRIDHFSTAGQRLCDFTSLMSSSTLPLWALLSILFLLKGLGFLAVGCMGLGLSKLTRNETLSFLAGIGAAGMASAVLYRLAWSISLGLIRAL